MDLPSGDWASDHGEREALSCLTSLSVATSKTEMLSVEVFST